MTGGDEAAALAGLAAAWGRDWAAARDHLVTLLLAAGRVAAAGRVEGMAVGEQIGWRCPGCRRCLAPGVRSCPHCVPPAAQEIDPATKKAVEAELKKRYVRGPRGEAGA